MRADKGRTAELVAVFILVGVVAAVYTYTSRLLQGDYVVVEWTAWVSWYIGLTDQKALQQYVPVEVLGQLLLAMAAAYILGFRRRSIWQWLASQPIPSWLSQTSIACVVEIYLTGNHKMQRKALTHLPKDVKTVVDVGCGGAAYLSRLTGVHKIGLDISPKRLRIAKQHCNEVTQGDITKDIPVEADAALCFEVIEHLTEGQGDKLLHDLEKFPTVILTTPREFFEVRRDGYERHQSFWSAEKLSQYGYERVGGGKIPPSDIYVRRP